MISCNFDHLHEGDKNLIRHAFSKCGKLIVLICDEVSPEWDNRPEYCLEHVEPFQTRIDNIISYVQSIGRADDLTIVANKNAKANKKWALKHMMEFDITFLYAQDDIDGAVRKMRDEVEEKMISKIGRIPFKVEIVEDVIDPETSRPYSSTNTRQKLAGWKDDTVD